MADRKRFGWLKHTSPLRQVKLRGLDKVGWLLLERFARKAQVPSKLVLDTARETADKMMSLWPTIQRELPLDRTTRHQIVEHMKSIPLLQSR